MITLGVTGGIGSGKSLVCNIFKVLKIPVYRADTEARRIMDEDPCLHEELIDHFGEQVFRGGSLNRSWLAARIFNNDKEREFVDALVHPAVYRDFLHWKDSQAGAPYVIEEAALLFESGADRELDRTVLVTAPLGLRIARIMKRDKMKRKEIAARISSQIEPEEAAKKADFQIVNDDRTYVLPQVLDIHKKILDLI